MAAVSSASLAGSAAVEAASIDRPPGRTAVQGGAPVSLPRQRTPSRARTLKNAASVLRRTISSRRSGAPRRLIHTTRMLSRATPIASSELRA